jgi:LCP family protein required for cell wall assembly
MLVSINTKDPSNKSAYIMSIPRDLYVDIPGTGYSKINEAYQDGEKDKFSEADYPSGGMGLLEKTVSQHFGVKINYYALVNYTALEQAVNAVGGIQVNIQSSDPRGLYDPSPDLRNNRQPLVKLPNGTVTLNGTQALGLARARGDHRGSYGYGLGDFTRTENQRKILVGIKDKATSASTLSNPVKLGQLMDSFGNNVKTDFNSAEVRRLNTLMKDIPSSRITSASLNSANGKNLLANYRTRSGQSALVPAAGIDDYSQIQAFISGL